MRPKWRTSPLARVFAALLGTALLVLPLACGSGDASVGSTSPSSSQVDVEPPDFDRNSPTAVRDAAVAAIKELGPTRIVVRRNQARAGAESHSEQEFLLDAANHRARLTGDDFGLVWVDGRESEFFGGRSEGIVLERRLALEPPTGLPLPIPPDYVAMLSENDPKDVRQQGDDLELIFDRGLQQVFKDAQGTAVVRILLGPDLLPKRLESEAGVTLGGQDVEWRDLIEYEFTAIPPLTADDVQVQSPYPASGFVSVVELPLERPIHEKVQWGQYWFGREVAGFVLAAAEWRGRGDDPEHLDQSVVLRYERNPQPEREEEFLELTMSPADAELRGRMKDRKPPPLERQVAGQSARIAFIRPPEEGHGVIGAWIILPDASLSLWIEGAELSENDFLRMLNSLRPSR